jgi:hypothetical protein
MPLRTTSPAPPRYDASVERRPDPKNVFDRDPLLVPQLFIDANPPRYRRGRWWLAGFVSLGAISTMVYLVARYGHRGAMERVADAGIIVMHSYTRIVAGKPLDAP